MGAIGKIWFYGLVALWTGWSSEILLFFLLVSHIIVSDNQVNDQTDQIANKNQQGPQEAIHSSPFRIPVDPHDDGYPDYQEY